MHVNVLFPPPLSPVVTRWRTEFDEKRCNADFAGDLFVVVFSMDCRESFEEAIRLREAILETKVSATQSATKSRRSHYSLKVPMVIVGNKCDKDVKYVLE